MTLLEVAEVFGLAGYASAGNSIRNVRLKIRNDKDLSNSVDAINFISVAISCTILLYLIEGLMMETVNISEFRANLLKYLAKANQGKELNITSHGQVLATVVPPVNRAKRAKTRLKHLSKTALVADVLSPLNEDWDALK